MALNKVAAKEIPALAPSEDDQEAGSAAKEGFRTIILQAVEELLAEGKPHGKLCLGFTPDEEIGEGAELFDIPGFGADFAYTVDGGDAGSIEYENFNAASAKIDDLPCNGLGRASAFKERQNADTNLVAFAHDLPRQTRPPRLKGIP